LLVELFESFESATDLDYKLMVFVHSVLFSCTVFCFHVLPLNLLPSQLFLVLQWFKAN